jgi:hypothetical protein
MRHLDRPATAWHAHCNRGLAKPDTSMETKFESTYALIVRSEEKSRTILETVVYVAFILSAVFSIWQFAQHPVTVPAAGLTPCVACTTSIDNNVHS